MELIDVIKSRRSIRAYKDQKVEREKLLKVLDAGRLAPSARNEQNQKFVVVEKKEIIEKLFHACADQDFVKDAPVVIAACGTKCDHIMSCGQYSYPIDISIALTHMMLRAVDLGLGTCWMGAFNEKKVKQLLRIPDEVRVVAMMTLGYPRFRPTAKSRKPIEEIYCQDRWK